VGTIPKIDNGIVCIVDRGNVRLAAVISSYFSNPQRYFPLFLFPDIRVAAVDVVDTTQDHFISHIVGNEAHVLINNALHRIGGYSYIILAGLSNAQKSYILASKSSHAIEITDISEVQGKLSAVGITKRDELSCRSTEILKGLFLAQSSGKRLVIDEGAGKLPEITKGSGGIVVVEQKDDDASCVVAVNYAFAVGSNLEVVKPLAKQETRSVQNFIRKWKEEGLHNQLRKVLNKIDQRVGHIRFVDFEYATFFTDGLPYALGLENQIPCSHVNCSLRPDLFVLNCLIFENTERFNSAAVFSLEEYFTGGESEWLVEFLRRNNYYVRSLVGREATVRNLDFHAAHFPYDVLHISSHGGEVDGYAVEREFSDRRGKKHIVEYDEVLGFSPVPGQDIVEVHRKTIFRTFDGFIWMSPELKEQNIPQYVFEDMLKVLGQKEGKDTSVKREAKDKIPTSCAIRCSDSIHQGLFRTLASHSSPFVFNNTCWSWYEVAAFFLFGGARGYIGTLWAIRNGAAVAGARAFYENVFGQTILGAFHKATEAIKSSSDRGVYIFWGLHFSTLSAALNPEESRHRVFRELVRSLFSWIEHAKESTSNEVKRNSIEIVESIREELVRNFGPLDMEKLNAEIDTNMRNVLDGTRSSAFDAGRKPDSQRSIDHPVEFRKSK